MSGEAGSEFRVRLRRVEELVRTLEQAADPATREAARELVGTVLDLHRAGLSRLLGMVDAATGAAACAGDELLRGLLLLHGLHPEGPEARVRQALERVGPLLRGHGIEVVGVAVADEVVRVRLRESAGGEPSRPHGLRHVVEETVWEAAPDLRAVEIDGLAFGRVPLPLVAVPRPG
jgi:Fe-S cluster biogenesis protein NfuA